MLDRAVSRRNKFQEISCFVKVTEYMFAQQLRSEQSCAIGAIRAPLAFQL
jgi:hypothetical protein